jgi:hypothetical protein
MLFCPAVLPLSCRTRTYLTWVTVMITGRIKTNALASA